MKKNLVFCAALAMAFASCSNDEVTEITQSKAISFRTSIENVSRAVITTVGDFHVYSFLNSGTAYFNSKVSKNGDVWNTAPELYYWPTDAATNPLSFYGFAPESLNTEMTVNATTGFSLTNYTIKNTKDEDVIVAYNTASANSVAMNFRHALSQINIQAKNSSFIYTVDIQSISLKNVKNTGSFAFAPTVATSAGTTLEVSCWDDQSGAADYSTGAQTLAPNTGIAVSFTDANPWLLLPQDTDPVTDWTNKTGKAYIEISCKIYKDGTDKVYIFGGAETYGKTAIALDINWLPGYKYTYTLNFLGTDAGGGVNPDNGQPVLTPITFTCTVDEWNTPTPAESEMDMNKE